MMSVMGFRPFPLIAAGCHKYRAVCVYLSHSAMTYGEYNHDAAVDADALLLVTEWKQFRMPSLPVLKRTMRRPLIIDGRNIYDPEYMKEAGFTYDKIG